MYFKGTLKTDGSTSLSSRYGYCKAKHESGKKAVVITGKYGKNYWIFYTKTPNGSVVGEKIFPKVAVKMVWQKDDTLNVWIKSLATRRKTTKKRTMYKKKW